jgi:AraC-like DNA-binding protein
MGRAEGAMNSAIRTMQPHVSVRVLYPFAAALRHEGVDLDLVLAAAQIHRATYFDQDSLIPFTSARRFYFAASAASRDFALGLAAALHFAMAKFQVLEYLAASSTHLEAALDTLVNNERVLSDANAIHIDRRSEGILVRVEPLTAGWHHCWVEFAVGAIYLAGRRIPRDPAAATWRPIPWFVYAAPAYATEYEVFFGTRVRFNAPASGLLIPSAALQERLQSADTRLREVLDVHSKDLAIRGTSKPSLVERAQALVRKSLPNGDPGMDAIATRLHMSPSTLRRRLRQEGVTHRWLLREVRRDLAFVYLQRQDVSIDEVAYLVGYDDPTTFYKAFKRWTGSTPAEHRSRMLPAGEDASPPLESKPARQ